MHPPPLEGTGGPQAVDISGERLPGISEWAGSIGGEYSIPATFLGREGEFFVAGDASYRSDFSSSATPSRYLVVDGYSLLNGRVGFRASESWAVFLWGRNLTDEEYFEFLSAAPGGSGLYVGYVGDPRTYGVTLRGSF
jgi:iron complex outermembrane receptor protein